ncbi:MAG: hypothetical protein DRN29_10335 [Thermoplasmata archaeon]|nr:MAG: hypothetical protein DRN29_10335 [Thermoplasmata archaeon]
MFLVEMERGCPFRCKFCLVGNISKPSRFLREDKVLDVASRGLELTKNIGLIGSSIDEHPDIEEIVRKLYKMGARISVSSLRIDRLKTPVLENIRRSGTRSITVAPEAGTERLRKLIGKGIRDEDIEEGAFKIKIAGIREVKLYFMFGIPGEDEGDIRAIRDVASKFRDVKLTINFSPFIPKAHTPFERLPMERKETLEEKIKLIRSLLKGYELKFESPSLSLLQGVLSRGDENVGRSILELERIREWERIIPSWEKYVYGELKGELPWDKIDVG